MTTWAAFFSIWHFTTIVNKALVRKAIFVRQMPQAICLAPRPVERLATSPSIAPVQSKSLVSVRECPARPCGHPNLLPVVTVGNVIIQSKAFAWLNRQPWHCPITGKDTILVSAKHVTNWKNSPDLSVSKERKYIMWMLPWVSSSISLQENKPFARYLWPNLVHWVKLIEKKHNSRNSPD
jgi:hypothetical protein